MISKPPFSTPGRESAGSKCLAPRSLGARHFVPFLLLLLLAIYGFLYLVAFEPPLEDAFISFHCARNLWEGQGLVFLSLIHISEPTRPY